MATEPLTAGLTPKQAAVLATITHLYEASGEAVPAAYVARKLSISHERVRSYFRTLSDLGFLRGPATPAIPARTEGGLEKIQLPAAEPAAHLPTVSTAPLTRTVEMIPLSLRAAVNGSSVNAEARTVDLIFTTGAAVERYDWMTGKRYLETLSLDPAHVRLDRLNAGASVLDSHSGYSVSSILGAVVPGTVELRKKEGRATVRFSKREAVEPVWQDVQDGIIRYVSIGYRVYKFEETEGKNNALPVRKAIDWEPFEMSMVAIPADAGAQTRGDKAADTNQCVIVTDGQEEIMAERNANDTITPAAAAPPAAAPAVAPPDATRVGAQAEKERSASIRLAVRTAKLGEDVADELIASDKSVDAARSFILGKLTDKGDETPTRQHVEHVSGADEREKWGRGVTASILARAGVMDLVRLAQKAKPDHPALKDISSDPGEFRGLSLLDIARACLERAGVATRGMDKMKIASLALRDISGANGTSDFAVALENVLNKTLLAMYTITPDTWRRFCSVGSVTDFRPHPRYRTGFLSRLAVVVEGAEFINKQIPDAVKESITATTKGMMLTLSRQAIVNDDMSVFSRIAAQIGRACALSIEMDVYDLLALNAGLGPLMNDGLTLFHATHLNIGAGAALSVASVDADRVVLASQKDPASNEILDLRPAVLVIPVGLGGQARVINQAQYDTDIVANKFLVPNKVVGLYRDVVDTPRLAGTRRYTFADPNLMPTVEVAFLDGVQEPFLEMQEGWRVDGIEWKARLDYGVAGVEFRGAVTNAGV